EALVALVEHQVREGLEARVLGVVVVEEERRAATRAEARAGRGRDGLTRAVEHVLVREDEGEAGVDEVAGAGCRRRDEQGSAHGCTCEAVDGCRGVLPLPPERRLLDYRQGCRPAGQSFPGRQQRSKSFLSSGTRVWMIQRGRAARTWIRLPRTRRCE